jgi:uncharacterized RDD family membrane protein YckC
MTTGPEAGYYADPVIPGYIRYWDGTAWVPGTSRPAPGAPTREPDFSQQDVQQAAAQVREQLITASEPTNTDQRQAEQPQTESDPAEQPQSVATMVVPSAFGTRGYGGSAYGGAGWSGPPGGSGYDPSPYAAASGLAGEPRSESAAEPAVTVVELASAGSRVLARIIDLALAAVLSSPATATLLLIAHRHDHAYVERLRLQAQTTYRTLGMDATGIALWAAALVVLLITAMCFEALRIGRNGQTTGRRLVGVRVVSADTAAEIGTGAAFARALLFWLFAILPVIDVFALGGALWGRPYRQGLHEKLTRTISIKA